MKNNSKIIASKFADSAKSKINDKRFSLLEDKVSKIEEKVFKKPGRIHSNLSQQMLLLRELGIIDALNKLDLSANKLAILLSAILNGDKENIRKDLSKIYQKDTKLTSSTNWAYIQDIFEEAGLKVLSDKADLEYSKAKDKENK